MGEISQYIHGHGDRRAVFSFKSNRLQRISSPGNRLEKKTSVLASVAADDMHLAMSPKIRSSITIMWVAAAREHQLQLSRMSRSPGNVT